MPSLVYKLLIVFTTVIWGFSFVAMKDAVNQVEPAWLIFIRFMVASALLAIMFWKRLRASFNRECLLASVIVGFLLGVAYLAQTIGLMTITPGKNAFLTATYCVMVPFIWWIVAKRKPSIFNVSAAVVCIVGVGLISLDGAEASGSFMGFGEFMTVICAVFFACHIVAVSKFSEKFDVMVLTVYQFFWGGLFCGIWALIFEEPPTLEVLTNPDFLWSFGYLVIFASIVGLGIQNFALAHIPPAQASILLSLESVFGVIFGVIFYHDPLTLQLVGGFALVFAGVLISEALPQVKGFSHRDLDKTASSS